MLSRRSLLAAGGAAALLSACGGGGGGGGDDGPFGLAITAAGNVIIFPLRDPDDIDSTRALTGVGAGETVVGVDGRPSDLRIYVLTRDAGGVGRIYRLNSNTGAAALVSTLAADPSDSTAAYTTLAGTQFGIDFNPVADRLRVVSNANENLRVNVDTGLVITDDAINGVAAQISGVAYTNPFAGAVATTLYDIDPIAGNLYIQNPPNNGTVSLVGPLGVTATAVNGFDIDLFDRGYAALTVGGVTNLYRVNLSTGAATLVGPIGTGTNPVAGFMVL